MRYAQFGVKEGSTLGGVSIVASIPRTLGDRLVIRVTDRSVID